MEMQPVKSSMVSAVGYDPESRTLHVNYNGGGSYAYTGVPQAKFDALMMASSKGVHLNQHIKPHHPAVKK